MRNFIRISLLALAVQTNCATTNPILTKVGHVVDCSVEQVKQQIPQLVDIVATTLVSQDYIGSLVKLAKQYGDDVIICAVQFASKEAAYRSAIASGQGNADLIVVNANDYLARREVQFR